MTEYIKSKTYQGLGHIILNRPQALNALSLEMIRQMRMVLSDFEADNKIRAVIVTSASEKAFCAGGDVKAVALEAKRMQDGAKDVELCREIFREEYLLNSEIHHFKKPYVSFIDGICMGGGMGVSLHGSHSIVSEKTLFSMPEVFIGFFPDVGSGYIFNQLPPGVGEWLLLSGARIMGADMLQLGLADYYIESRGMTVLQETLVNSDWQRSEAASVLASQLSGYCEEKISVKSDLVDDLDVLKEYFSGENLQTMIYKMKKSDHPLIKDALARMQKACPLSMHLTLSHLRWARGKKFNDIIANEFRLSQFFTTRPDFYEGVRAVLIDKDNAAHWQTDFASLSENLYDDIQNSYSSLKLFDGNDI